ncbi:ATP-binding cassette domain-containing protein [Billgrantia montanilacus]|uniref:ATP-binding cassette domain-containing protein n=1 Tax=Billgrantia montanilacus TaxID=2282305 RepID=A0A368TPB7_9GAMM|nr:ATP-binding cassette domain-containing protein [Halomonas montanilacus]RCV86400.1 ATP-binding cassette domain-containing protein [Halomonas montanilacus]
MLILHRAGFVDPPCLAPIQDKVVPGELLAIVGPNGAGKSTLLSLLSGFRTSQLGVVTLDGRTIEAWTPATLASRRALVAQQEPMGFDWSVRDMVALGSDPEPALVEQLLADLELVSLADRSVLRLSGGERQRVMVARGLCQLMARRHDGAPDGGLLLLDEPTSALDIGQQQRLMRRLRQLARQQHMAIVCVLHELNLAGTYADRVWLMEEGQRIAGGPPEEVLEPEDLARIYRAELQALARPDGGPAWLALTP